jgi:hypothetical protein
LITPNTINIEILQSTMGLGKDIIRHMLRAFAERRPAGFRSSVDHEFCPQCDELVSKYSLLDAPEEFKGEKWCFDCINDYFDTRR